MTQNVMLALDIMGGDNGPCVTIPGAAHAANKHKDLNFILFGDENKIRPFLSQYPDLQKRSTIHHTNEVVSMDDDIKTALRKDSSMSLAIKSVKNGDAGGMVSAGNTGSLMTIAKLRLKTMPRISRPAIASNWPTLKGVSIVLDLGASIGGNADHLVSLAIIGSAMANVTLNIERPKVGLLNIGSEDIKGHEELKKAHKILKDKSYNIFDYKGFVEGNDIGKGIVDVVVTEGFVGNIALKVAEGTTYQLAAYVKEAINMSFLSKIGALLSKQVIKYMKDRLKPGLVTGGVFLGLNGIVIKAHGNCNAEIYAGSISFAYNIVKNKLLDKITNLYINYDKC